MCLDLHDSVNPYLDIQTCRLEDIKTVLPRITPGCYFSSWDLRGMYHQIKLDPSITSLFGFAVPDCSGILRYYKYLSLPFGCATAVYIAERLLRPLKLFCHSFGVDISIYIDDGIIIEIDSFKCLMSLKFVIYVLSLAGWTLNFAKSVLVPATTIKYLGYYLNSIDMLITLPGSKIDKIHFLLTDLLHSYKFKTKVKAKYLASLLGLLCHAYYTHGNFVRYVSRNAQHLLGVNVSNSPQEWNTEFLLTADLAVEFELCQAHLDELNGQPIRCEQAHYEMIDRHQISYVTTTIDPRDFAKPYDIFVSDSSADTAYTYKSGSVTLCNNYLFSADEQQLSSGARELLAVVHAFNHFQAYFESRRGSVILWVTDSQCCYSFLMKGSRVPYVQRLLIKIKL